MFLVRSQLSVLLSSYVLFLSFGVFSHSSYDIHATEDAYGNQTNLKLTNELSATYHIRVWSQRVGKGQQITSWWQRVRVATIFRSQDKKTDPDDSYASGKSRGEKPQEDK